MSTIDMEEELKKAQVLVEALPYIQKFSRKIIVVKYGVSAVFDRKLFLFQNHVAIDICYRYFSCWNEI